MSEPSDIIKTWISYTAGEVATYNDRGPSWANPEIYGESISYLDGERRRWRFQDRRGYFRFIAEYWDFMERWGEG